MKLPIWQAVRALTVCTLITSLAVPPNVSAQAHVVSRQEMRDAIVGSTQTRQSQRDRIVSFLSSGPADRGLRAAGMDLNLVKTAVSVLSDEELAQLSARADKAQADFAAGRLSDRDLLIILIGIAALILIIVAVD
jgi:hypothetical protein